MSLYFPPNVLLPPWFISIDTNYTHFESLDFSFYSLLFPSLPINLTLYNLPSLQLPSISFSPQGKSLSITTFQTDMWKCSSVWNISSCYSGFSFPKCRGSFTKSVRFLTNICFKIASYPNLKWEEEGKKPPSPTIKHVQIITTEIHRYMSMLAREMEKCHFSTAGSWYISKG